MEENLCIFTKDQPPNVKFGNEGILPEDVLVEILIRLSVRHLLRLKCVCKSWYALIDDINFINRHYRVHYSICEATGDIPGVCQGNPIRIYFPDVHMFLLSKRNGYVPLDLTPDLARDSAASFTSAPVWFRDCEIVGVVNGVICLMWGYLDLGMWNPATREFKAITPWMGNHIELIGFGFDCISNDFKIVRGYYNKDDPLFEVYSLTTNSWTRLRETWPLVMRAETVFTSAYLNGVCYWFAEYVYNADIPCSTEANPLILSFNFETEIFEVFNLPPNTIGSKVECEHNLSIATYRGCLAFAVNRTDLAKRECNFDVWIMTESQSNSRVPKSWQHLFTLGPFPSSNILRLDRFRIDGDVLFTVRYHSSDDDREFRVSKPESSLYNPSTGTFRNLGFILSMPSDYVESLFSISKKFVWNEGLLE